jgi:twitching motility protein PilT
MSYSSYDLVSLMQDAAARGASDIHLSAFCPPMMRVGGVLIPLGSEALDVEGCRALILSGLSEIQRARLEETWELDFLLDVAEIGRFRGNAHFSRGALEAAYRLIPSTVPDLAALGHRPSASELCTLEEGLLLITGSTGSGKSTTLAAMVQQISHQRSGIIVTIEDPIEFLFTSSLSLVKQREVGTDTRSFSAALRHSLRQDPDVIVVSEMRDQETIQAALTAAETGHLVIGTLHTIDAPKTIDRIVDVFPPDQQNQIITQLANCLKGVVSQRLLPRKDGQGRVLAVETMFVNSGVASCIRDRKVQQLVGMIEIGKREGMNTIDESIADLYHDGLISHDEALANVRDPHSIPDEEEPRKRGLFG